jgi:Zn-dependent protease/predicted transcriptional regulator
MLSGFRIARIAGIDIEINISWLVILALLTFTLAEGVFPNQYEGWQTATYWAVGLAAALLLFVTVLVHEMAHALVAIRRGLPVPKITLFIFGGVSHLSRQPREAGEEFKIAAAGPATSVLVAIVCGLIALAVSDVNEQALAIFAYLATVNVLLAVFNMLPGFPLDGGRVLRSIIWRSTGSFRKATAAAGRVGQLFGYGIMAVGFMFALGGAVIGGIWFIVIGWFLSNAARGEAESVELERVLGRLAARDVMRSDYVTVPPNTPLQAIVDRYVLGEGTRAVMVADDGTVAGILTVTDLQKVPRDEWPRTPAREVMTPREKVTAVQASDKASEVLRIVGQNGLNQVPVLEDGRMIGLITRRELVERVELESTFGSPAAEGTAGER